MSEVEEWLDTPHPEDESITNRYIVEQLYSMLEEFYETNNLIKDDPGRIYSNFVKFVYNKSRY